ncbi:hypothetical protein Avbf_05177 [Armadillidium vulgare]|nr:hypothetical protein Avbf_05177 [Armadillidium vulgare]
MYYYYIRDVNISVSVPGSPARLPPYSIPLQVRKNSHIRALSEETSSVSTCIGTASASYASEGILAPVLPPGKKQPSPKEVLLTHPLLTSSTNPSSAPNLLPINRNTRTRRSKCISTAFIKSMFWIF